MKSMMGVKEASELIHAGKNLLIAGDEKLLSELPVGNWIGGTTPYFMSEDGGLHTHELLQAIVLPDSVVEVKAKLYAAGELHSIPRDYLQNGFTIIIVPAFTEAHVAFAKDSSSWPDVFSSPLMGWISGVDSEEIGKSKPKVFNGQTGEVSDWQAVAFHAQLPDHLLARVHTSCMYQAGEGDTIAFPTGGFEVTDCLVNGVDYNFAEYLLEKKIDISAPMVGNHFGAIVHVSLAKIDAEAEKVYFYAPIFPGLRYHFSKPKENFAAEYAARFNGHHAVETHAVYSCNCILNYTGAQLDGKKTSDLIGPVVFGEIAYMLLNQTLVYLTIEPK